MRHNIHLISAGLVIFGGAAFADTTINMQQTGSAANGASVTYIKDGMMRVESGMGDGYMLFDSAADTMTIVQPDEGTYMVIDQARMESMGNAMEQMRAQMEAQLANLPPEQREQMRRMMGDRLGGLMASEPQAEPEIVRTGEEKTINGYSCEVVTITMKGTMSGSACMASRAELGVPESDYKTMRAMMAFSQSMTEQFAQGAASVQAMAKLDGIPVQFNSSVAGMEVSGTLESVSMDALDSSLFTIPEGLEEEQMPKMPMG